MILVLERDNGALCENLRHSSLQGLLCLLALAALLAHPLFHLVRSFQLLDYDQLEPELDKLMSVLVETLLGKAYVHLAAHPFQLKVFVAHRCILVEHFVELAELEEDDLVEVVALYPPVLLHCFSEALGSLRRNVESCWIVLGMVWPSSFVVTTSLRCCPLRSRIGKLFSQSCISHCLVHSDSFYLYFLFYFFRTLCCALGIVGLAFMLVLRRIMIVKVDRFLMALLGLKDRKVIFNIHLSFFLEVRWRSIKCKIVAVD